MRRRLFWAIFGVAASSLILVVLGTVWTVNSARERATRAELARAAEAVAERVGELVADGDPDATLDTLRRPALARELQTIRRVAGAADIALFVVREGGEVIGPRGLPRLPQLAGVVEGPVDTAVGGDRTLLVHARAVGELPGGATLGVVLTRPAPVELRIPRGVIAGGLAVVAVGAAAAAWILSRRFTARLEGLAAAAGAVASGELDVRVDDTGDDELAHLAGAFNRMAGELAEARERERNFLLSVGHDLRTPLTTVAGYAEALQEGPPTERVRRIGEVVESETRRLSRLIEDLMLLARVESAEFTLRPEPVDLAAHLTELVEAFRARAEAADLRLEVDITPVGTRMVDPDRFSQVVGNLVENALRYTPPRGTVRVRLEADDGLVRLTVSDSGTGIEPDDLPHIFERFYVSRRYRGVRPEGSGLGLSIVKSLVEAMGGRVEAATDGGTVIRVELPLPPVGNPSSGL
jgi:two-component system sensor histidine kinase BaeS